MKNCKNCLKGACTESLKGLVQTKNVDISKITLVYCLGERKFKQKLDVCKAFEQRIEQ